MRYIQLSQGMQATVDDTDYYFLMQWKWYYGKSRNNGGYAMRTEGRRTILMHKVLCIAPEGMEVDHKNRNKLDNRRDNLRSVSRTINQLNRDLFSSNRSGYRGISWSKRDKGYYVYFRISGRTKNFGFFRDLQEAIARRDEARQFQLSTVGG